MARSVVSVEVGMRLTEEEKRPILLFDGVCNLCHGAVKFVIKRDGAKILRFASLQSSTAQRLLEERGVCTSYFQSVVLLEGSRVYTKSTAALRITRYLSGAWPLVYGLIVVPRGIRDWLYDWVARNRYKWFGTQKTCLLMTPGMEDRFLTRMEDRFLN